MTTSILPVVEQYAQHSEAVWEGSKVWSWFLGLRSRQKTRKLTSNLQFWKQFFEASANVSLSGYEEAGPEEDATHDQTQTTETDETYGTPSSRADDTITGTPVHNRNKHARPGDSDSSDLDSPTASHAPNTPRLPSTAEKSKSSRPEPTFADLRSPYESMKQEAHTTSPPGTSAALPHTPGKPSAEPLPDTSMSPASSPFAMLHTPGSGRGGADPNPDPVLHRMLDKTFRIQATPHTGRRRAAPGKHVPATPGTASRRPLEQQQLRRLGMLDSPEDDDDDDDDDLPARPQLRAELFSSPIREEPRTPGVSVHAGSKRTPRSGFRRLDDGGGASGTGGKSRLWESESEDGTESFSPPKTLTFQVPQSRLLQTPGEFRILYFFGLHPCQISRAQALEKVHGREFFLADKGPLPVLAREASKRIVEDLLLTAGGDVTDSIDDSPSIVRRNRELDDSF